MRSRGNYSPEMSPLNPNAMLELAKSLPPSQLAQKAYALYEKFRPEIPPGKKG